MSAMSGMYGKGMFCFVRRQNSLPKWLSHGFLDPRDSKAALLLVLFHVVKRTTICPVIQGSEPIQLSSLALPIGQWPAICITFTCQDHLESLLFSLSIPSCRSSAHHSLSWGCLQEPPNSFLCILLFLFSSTSCSPYRQKNDLPKT